MRFLAIVVLVLGVASIAHAKPMVNETFTEHLTVVNLTGRFICRAGQGVDRVHYPTPSSFEIINLAMPYGSTRIGTNDPQFRIGDHCAELERELESLLPADLVITRTVTERFEIVSGVCTNSYREDLTATLGPFSLVGGNGGMVIGRVDPARCR